MPIIRPFEVACPLCGFTNRFRLKADTLAALTAQGRTSARELVTCDSEVGGCDKDFVFDLTAEIIYTATTFTLGEVKADAAETDRRVWTVKTIHADDPESNRTDFFTAEQMRGKSKDSPLYALTLGMGDGDSLKFASCEGLSTVYVECSETDPPRTFASFAEACRVARNDARDTGQTHNVFFDGERFRVYPDDADTFHFELVKAVEPPVVFKITVGERAGERLGTYQAQVYCDDTRANPDIQAHGDSEIFVTSADAFHSTPEAAARDAAQWIHAEFGDKLDVNIQSEFDIDAEDIPL